MECPHCKHTYVPTSMACPSCEEPCDTLRVLCAFSADKAWISEEFYPNILAPALLAQAKAQIPNDPAEIELLKEHDRYQAEIKALPTNARINRQVDTELRALRTADPTAELRALRTADPKAELRALRKAELTAERIAARNAEKARLTAVVKDTAHRSSILRRLKESEEQRAALKAAPAPSPVRYNGLFNSAAGRVASEIDCRRSFLAHYARKVVAEHRIPDNIDLLIDYLRGGSEEQWAKTLLHREKRRIKNRVYLQHVHTCIKFYDCMMDKVNSKQLFVDEVRRQLAEGLALMIDHLDGIKELYPGPEPMGKLH